jgi:hypothetical protein
MIKLTLFPEDEIRKGCCPEVYGLAISNNFNDGELFPFKLLFQYDQISWIKHMNNDIGDFIENVEFNIEDIKKIKKIFAKHRNQSCLTCNCISH